MPFLRELSVTRGSSGSSATLRDLRACVLRLRRLDPPGHAPDASFARGSALYGVLDRFISETAEALPPDARDRFRKATQAELELAALARDRLIWSAWLDRIADWFLSGEAEFYSPAGPSRELRAGALDRLPATFAVTARADRIDRTPDGGYAIYDYKSGTTPGGRPAPSICNSRSKAPSRSPAAFPGLPPGPVHHLELIGLGAPRSSRDHHRSGRAPGPDAAP